VLSGLAGPDRPEAWWCGGTGPAGGETRLSMLQVRGREYARDLLDEGRGGRNATMRACAEHLIALAERRILGAGAAPGLTPWLERLGRSEHDNVRAGCCSGHSRVARAALGLPAGRRA